MGCQFLVLPFQGIPSFYYRRVFSREAKMRTRVCGFSLLDDYFSSDLFFLEARFARFSAMKSAALSTALSVMGLSLSATAQPSNEVEPSTMRLSLSKPT